MVQFRKSRQGRKVVKGVIKFYIILSFLKCYVVDIRVKDDIVITIKKLLKRLR